MSDLTLKERLIFSLEKKDVDKIPVCSVTQTATVELMEITGCKWPEAHFNPEKMAALAIAGHTIAGLEAVRFPFCTTVIAQTLGCTFNEGSIDMQPYQTDFPCRTGEDVRSVTVPANLLESPRIKTMLEAASLIRSGAGNDVPVIAGMIGPAATAFYLCGARNYLKWCLTAPELLEILIDTGTRVCIEYANALLMRGLMRL